jgi:hypothetical protein
MYVCMYEYVCLSSTMISLISLNPPPRLDRRSNMKQQGAMEPCQLEVEDMAMDVFERMRLRESTLRHEHDKMHEDKQRHVKLMTRDYTEVRLDHKTDDQTSLRKTRPSV